MKSLDRFKLKMKLSGGSLRNENINNSRKLLEEVFEDDASFSLGIYFWELGVKDYEERETIKIRLFDRKYSNANGVTVAFQTMIDCPVVVGDVIYDSLADEYLICTEAFNIDSVHYQGKFTLCNWMLRWQLKDGTIVDYPCYNMNSTQYNSGETSNKQFTVSSSQHTLTLPYDENTVVLNSPQRFYLDRNPIKPITYIVTQNDTTSNYYGKKGVVKVTVVEYAEDTHRDRPDLGICDYVEVNKPDVPTGAKILYTTKVIKSGGDSQVFTGKFYDDEGNEIADTECHWEVVCDFADELKIERIGQSGNQIKIGIDNDDCVDEEVKLILSDAENQYSDSLIIKIESLL